jgi:thymidylate kinase
MKMKNPRNITIFEGPDGGGKSTAAKDFAAATDADYIHFPAVKKIQQLSRIYVEAALPALKGERDVVFDRSWLSETPYGKVFRDGMDRVGVLNTRMLERLFMRCGTVVVKCMPSVESCIATFKSRQDEEMLDSELQLRLVYDEYSRLETGLPTVIFDYTKGHILPYSSIDGRRFTKHPATMKSVGNFDGQIIIVGPGFHDHNDYNCFHQFPFVDLNPVGKRPN